MYFDPWFLQSTAGASLLANASPLTLMTSPLSVTNQNVTLGMLGGLVPVTMPFQFPLELLGFGTDTAGMTATTGSTSAAFHHSLTHNLLKGLQPGAQHAATLSHSPLPTHLQQAFNDGGQSKGDTKLPRKSQWLPNKQRRWDTQLADGIYLMGKYSCSHRAAVLSMFTFSRPKHCGEEEKEKKTLLE